MGRMFLGSEWAPLYIPWPRRRQTLAVVLFITLFLIFPGFCLVIPYYLLFHTKYWWTVILYGIWFYYDRNSPKTGARPNYWIRNWGIWKDLRDYFPVTLERTAELDPNKNYILGYHPHGMMSIGAFVNFVTEATNFRLLFPGLTSRLLTLEGQFYFPIRRELSIAMGGCDTSKRSIGYLLNPKRKGNAVVLVVGGAQEAVDSIPGYYQIFLNRRKGFVRMALKYGAHLVPVLSFGENDLYRILFQKDSTFKIIQNLFKQYMGLPVIFFHGRGVFNYTRGLLPFRKPIHTIVGKPIAVDLNLNPSQEEIDYLHQQYIDGLTEIFENNKEKFGIDKKVQLHIY